MPHLSLLQGIPGWSLVGRASILWACKVSFQTDHTKCKDQSRWAENGLVQTSPKFLSLPYQDTWTITTLFFMKTSRTLLCTISLGKSFLQRDAFSNPSLAKQGGILYQEHMILHFLASYFSMRSKNWGLWHEYPTRRMCCGKDPHAAKDIEGGGTWGNLDAFFFIIFALGGSHGTSGQTQRPQKSRSEFNKAVWKGRETGKIRSWR